MDYYSSVNMTANLIITKKIENNSWVVNMSVGSGADIPMDIFLYSNNAGVPGDFFAICALADWQRYQTYQGTNIPPFSNKYLKLTAGHQVLDIGTDIMTYINGLLDAATRFRLEYLALAAQSTNTYPI